MKPWVGLPVLAVLLGFMTAIQGCGGESTVIVTKGVGEPIANGPVIAQHDSAGPRGNEAEVNGIEQASGPGPGTSAGGQKTPYPTPLSTEDVPEGVSPALARDAQWYADQYGVELPEAITRLTLQEPIGKMGAAIEANEKGTFAGLWIQHEPDYRVVVAFTKDGEGTVLKYIRDERLREIIEVRTAEATLRHLQDAQMKASRLVRGLGFQTASGINVFENRVEIYAADRTALEEALRENGKTLPDHVVIIGP